MRHPLPFGPCATLLALALATLLTGCGASPDDAAEGAAPPIALVALAAAAPHTMRATITALGTVELAPDAAQEIAVPYEALVQRVLINRGTRIVRGQPLLELVASSGAHVAPEQAHRDASLAAAEQARLQRMHAQGLATDNELRNAANAAANAREQVAALAPEGSAARTQIVRAPRAGVVDTLSAQQGTIVAAGASLARVAQPDDLVARLGFEPADIAHLDTSVGEREIVITPLRAPAQHVAAHVAPSAYRAPQCCTTAADPTCSSPSPTAR